MTKCMFDAPVLTQGCCNNKLYTYGEEHNKAHSKELRRTDLVFIAILEFYSGTQPTKQTVDQVFETFNRYFKEN